MRQHFGQGRHDRTPASSAAISSKRRIAAAAIDHAEYLAANNDGSGLASDLD